MPVIVHIKVVDIPSVAQLLFPLVFLSRPLRFPSCSPLTMCSMSLLCRSSRFSGAGREKLVEIPQLQLVFFPGQGRSQLVVVQRQMPVWFRRQ